MRIIPAIDLKGGIVVHGIAGRRAEYQPLTSCLATDPQPATVAQALVHLGLAQFYVADLDAIGGAQPDWTSYNAILDAGGTMWIDAGVADARQARELAEYLQDSTGDNAIVVGLETVGDAASLDELVQVIGSGRLIFSLDLFSGVPRAAAPQWQQSRAQQIAADAVAAGVRRLIVLDVAAVGISQGCPTLALCRELRGRFPEIELTSGGGIRGPGDLEQLAAAGCDAALVATALHDGRLGKEALQFNAGPL